MSVDTVTTTHDTDTSADEQPQRDEAGITDHEILYGTAPAADDAAAPAADADALARLDPFAPMSLDELVFNRVDIRFEGRTYEMIPMDEFGAAGRASFYRHWNAGDALEDAARTGFYPPRRVLAPTATDPFHHEEIPVPYEYEPAHDAEIRKHKEACVRVFLPKFPVAKLRKLSDQQIDGLVQRFLVLISEPTPTKAAR